MVSLTLIAAIGLVAAFLLFGDGATRTKTAISELKEVKEEIQSFIPKNSETTDKVDRTKKEGEGIE